MRRLFAITAAALLFLGSATVSAQPANPAPTAQPVRADSIYCVVHDTRNRQAYYSGVFPGDYSNSPGYQRSFPSFVDARYGETPAGTQALCLYENTAQEAMDDGNDRAVVDRRDGYNVIWTRWVA